jgi:hypothetical protein
MNDIERYIRDTALAIEALRAEIRALRIQESAALTVTGNAATLDFDSASSTLTVPTSGTVAYADGWTAPAESWVYFSATQIVMGGDTTGIYSKGDKLRFKQGGGYKYFYITLVTWSDPFTFINAAMTDIYYSKASTPVGFPDYFNYTPAYTGFSVSPSNRNVRFRLDGLLCHVQYNSNTVGTSNATTLTISLPIAARTEANWKYSVNAPTGMDNGVVIANVRLDINSGGTTVSAFKDGNGTAWTAAGNKQVYTFTLAYEIN